MKILHFGDIHVWRWSFDWSDPFYPKRWLGFVNLGLRRRHKFPPHLAETVAAEIAESDADVVIFTGDYSTMSLESEFRRAAELMEPIRRKWGERFIQIPGNHDRYSPKSKTRYDKWFPEGKIDGVRTWTLDESTVVVGYDASRPFKVRSNGEMTKDLENQLDEELAKQSEKTVILIGHYPYANPPEHPESWDHKLLGEERLAALVAKHKPLVYLHGHKHVRWELRPESTPDTLCLNCGAAGMKSSKTEKQAGYLTFEVNAGAIENITPVHQPIL